MSLLENISKEEHINSLRKKLSKVKLKQEIDEIVELVSDIIVLKEEKNAVILGHNYMTPEVFYGVSDYVGDSLGLAQHAAETNADIILFNGVHFMAETAKILNPSKKVLIADLKAGCSLAESITKEDLKRLRLQYPDVPIVAYINCTGEVKAECDVICTSANAVKIVNSLESDKVIMLPDGYLAANVQKETDKEIIIWAGKCMVHELYSETDVDMIRKTYPDAQIVAHPECKPEVTSIVDYTGSTTQMMNYIKESKSKEVLLMTECSMGDNLQVELPEVDFISSCQTCPHMKRITLEKIKVALIEEKYEINISPEIIENAKKSLDKMLAIGR